MHKLNCQLRGRGLLLPPPKFVVIGNLSENPLLIGEFSSQKCKKMGLKPLILKKFRGKIEIFST